MNADALTHFDEYHFAENRKTWDRYVSSPSEEQLTRDVAYSHGSGARPRGFRFHDMRHSTASIMAAGERPEVIQRVMRHSKVSFTIDPYVKVYRDDVRDAVQRNDRPAAAR